MGNIINDLQKKRDDAYNGWKNVIKQALTGVEKEVFGGNNDMEFKGLQIRLDNYGFGADAFVDKITYNETHGMFKLHFTAIDYKECDKWLLESDVTSKVTGIDQVLEHIIWQDKDFQHHTTHNVDIFFEFAMSVKVEADSIAEAERIVQERIEAGIIKPTDAEPTEAYELDTSYQQYDEQ